MEINIRVVACDASLDDLKETDGDGTFLVPCDGLGYPWRWCDGCSHRREGHIDNIQESLVEWDTV